jgi:hypothetical protein
LSTNTGLLTTIYSVSAIAAKYGPDIANFVYGATTGDAMEPIPTSTGSQSSDAGVAFGKLFKKADVILDFFGGRASRFKNGISIDPIAEYSFGGFKGSIEQFSEIFKGSKFKQIVAENPYGSFDYLKVAAELLEKGGTITVRGSENNKYFNKLLKGTLEGLENFSMESRKLIDPIGNTTAGKPIESKEFYEVVLKRN